MRVETFKTDKGLTRYILVDSCGLPIKPVLCFLRFKDNIGRARNTMKAYCFHLKFYFGYLESLGMTFEEVGIDELAGFLRYLQNDGNYGNVISFVPKRAARTVNVYLTTVYAFYDYLTRHEEYSLRLSDKLIRTMPVSRRGFKDFLYHLNVSKRFEARIIKLKEPKTRPEPLKKPTWKLYCLRAAHHETVFLCNFYGKAGCESERHCRYGLRTLSRTLIESMSETAVNSKICRKLKQYVVRERLMHQPTL